MGKQYKVLREKDINFINEQKLFYLASSSSGEVNLSPKGYDTLRVLSNDSLVFLHYPGSGNRTYRDALADGEFTLVFNSFTGKPMILRLFCKAKVIEDKSEEFYKYVDLFNENANIVRNFFKFEIYAVESSCGQSVPIMEYKEDRSSLRDWAIKMDKNKTLEKYNEDHLVPPNMKTI